MPAPDHAKLQAYATDQLGCFTRAQALECHLTPAAVRSALRTQRWSLLGRGVYIVTSVWNALDSTGQHLSRVQARLLTLQAGWVAGRRSSAMALGLPLLGPEPAVPQLLHDLTTARARACSRHERLAALPADDVTAVGSLAVATAARTVVDLARAETFRSAVVVADGALRGPASRQELEAVLTRCATWPGARDAAQVVAFADGLSETPLESISRVAVHELGLPAPELQVEIWFEGQRIARPDFLWRAHNLVGLADGAVKYQSRADLMAEKWQVERLEDLGLEVVRWGWDDAYRWSNGMLEGRIRRGLARGGRQERDPGVHLVRTTIEANRAVNARLDARRRA